MDKSSDCQLFIFKINEIVANKNSESRYILIERTPMTMPFLDPRDSANEKKSNRVSWYVIIRQLYYYQINKRIFIGSVIFRINVSRFNRSGYLEKGSYLIVPSTTGCKLKKRRAQPSTNVQLVRGLFTLQVYNY